MMHSLAYVFDFDSLLEKTILSAAFRVKLESAMRVPQRCQLFIDAQT
jgi:hypothetical protein